MHIGRDFGTRASGWGSRGSEGKEFKGCGHEGETLALFDICLENEICVTDITVIVLTALSLKQKNQITGLGNNLLPRLPSKLSTVVSANEDELLRAGEAVNDAIQANTLRLGQAVSVFYQTLTDTVNELEKLATDNKNGADFQAMVTASPTRGITVSDLWAAHSSRRAWAVRGSNVQCQNGEVVQILGGDGSGKTRLLTAIAERIFAPPKSARTTTYVRGSITVAGVDISKWDRL